MKRVLTGIVFTLAFHFYASAQEHCETATYQSVQEELNPLLKNQLIGIENFISQKLESAASSTQARGEGKLVLTIPVVFHVLYHTAGQNISDQQIHSQITVLNEAFRRLSADTVNTPERFRDLAADCEIEFKLAISDVKRRATTGIIRKYTPISSWDADDKMKFSSEMGSDGWDANQFLNIWVCNLRRALGYASFPGGEPAKDGIVLNFGIVGITSSSSYGMGKVAVHEAGHWLGLRHIWGDDYCGDDWVDDTPKQANFTTGCPTGIRKSCGNGASGDMYMNYMDITNDPCLNLFTIGQKARMRVLFEPGGPREGLLTSLGLQQPLVYEIPIQEEPPRWLHPNMYPNPAQTQLTIDLAYDARWVGNTIVVTNMQGQRMMLVNITTTIQTININHLKPGMYLISSRRKDGATWKEKLVVR